MTLDRVNDLAKTIPESVYMTFQTTFAIITPALIYGAFADRMKSSALLWFIGLWASASTRRSHIGFGGPAGC
jgi:Amt family ammonium transporter